MHPVFPFRPLKGPKRQAVARCPITRKAMRRMCRQRRCLALPRADHRNPGPCLRQQRHPAMTAVWLRLPAHLPRLCLLNRDSRLAHLRQIHQRLRLE